MGLIAGGAVAGLGLLLLAVRTLLGGRRQQRQGTASGRRARAGPPGSSLGRARSGAVPNGGEADGDDLGSDSASMNGVGGSKEGEASKPGLKAAGRGGKAIAGVHAYHVYMHAYHAYMHAYYACMHAYHTCMHMYHACMRVYHACMHAYHTYIHVYHAYMHVYHAYMHAYNAYMHGRAHM